MVKCHRIIEIMNRIAPRELAEEWDNPGLLVGSPEAQVEKVLLSLDVDDNGVKQAIDKGVQLIIAHHPLIFKPMKQLRTDLPLGRRLEGLLSHGIGVFAAHTNLDIAKGGVNDVLAKKLGLIEVSPFSRDKAFGDELTLGRMGKLPEPMEAEAFAAHVKESLGADSVRLVKGGTGSVSRVALCGGSAAEFISKAAFLGADAYVTGDVRYHDAQRAMDCGIHVVDAGHYATELPIVRELHEMLDKEFSEAGIEVELMEASPTGELFVTI